jgi:DNA-binding MarR family transcriptional regulator
MDRTSELLSERELAAWRGLLATHSSLIAGLDDELEREHAIPLTSYEVLMYLGDAEDGQMRMGELADRLLLSRSGITRLVDRLQREGLVERHRCRDDGRGYFAALTPAGRDKLNAARADHLAGVRRRFLARLEPGELEALSRIWARLLGQET